MNTTNYPSHFLMDNLLKEELQRVDATRFKVGFEGNGRIWFEEPDRVHCESARCISRSRDLTSASASWAEVGRRRMIAASGPL